LRLALIIELLAARQGQFKLGASFFIELELERHQCHAFAFHCADQLIDLAAVQQQLSRPLGRMIEKRLACKYSGMLELISQTSPPRASA
jgi:hypothetical protein